MPTNNLFVRPFFLSPQTVSNGAVYLAKRRCNLYNKLKINAN